MGRHHDEFARLEVKRLPGDGEVDLAIENLDQVVERGRVFA